MLTGRVRNLTIALFTIALLGMDASSLRVTGVRYYPARGSLRVAIETSGSFRFHTERLSNPNRVFFDLFGARPKLAGKGVRNINVNHKLVSRIRVAETLPGVTRIVLDLTCDAEVQASQLSNPDRLIVEVMPPGTEVAVAGRGSRAEPVRAAPAEIRQFVLPAPVTPPPIMVSDAPVLAAERQVAPALMLALAMPTPLAPPPPVLAVKPALSRPVRSSLPPPAVVARSGPARAAKSDSEGGRSLIRTLGLKINRVVLDPGHGGHDQGTVGPNGVVEKDLVLDVAKRLGALIQKRLGAEVIYTREDDTFIPLEQRTAMANERGADLFLSLHANSSHYRSVAGIETFYLNFTDSKESLEVAARENASSQKTVYELRDLVQQIALHDKAEESREFAGKMQGSLYAFAARNNPAAKNRGVKKAPFVVLIGARMPSVLVEIGFVTNPRDESLLKRSEHRQRLAEALYRGLSRYSDGLSHFQVAGASSGDRPAGQ